MIFLYLVFSGLFAAFFDCTKRPLCPDEPTFIGTPPLVKKGRKSTERKALEIETCYLKDELILVMLVNMNMCKYFTIN
jgi:hypothetical protein